ncbi:MAG: FAD-dependent oxidoreductase [Hyphomicrobium sp.]
MHDEFDVVVVGGGPVGLWVACELALAKIKVVVLERRVNVVDQSRALAIQGRTIEVFAMRGLADRLLTKGRTISKGHFGGLGTPLDFSPFDTRFPITLLLPQATTEAVLEARALELGVDIRRGHLVVSTTSFADCVIVEGLKSETPFRCSSRYVVGADGAQSLIRREAGIGFVGHPARNAFLLAEAVLEAPPGQSLVTIVNEKGALLVAPRGDHVHHRIVVNATLDRSPSEPVSFDEIKAAAVRIAGTDYRPRDPIWLTRFTDETRLAEHYRRGRIFLAGDAAHIHAPMGGQGLNVGIQDAMNLGWKLANVLHGAASDSLLGTYERERWKVGEMLRRNTLAQVALFCNFDPAALAMRSLFEDLLRMDEINRLLAAQGSGYSVAYAEPLYAPEPGWQHRDGISGNRVPDLDLLLEDGSRAALYGFMNDGSWLNLHRAPESGKPAGAMPLKHIRLAAEGNHELLGNLSSVLVRPDGYIGHVKMKEADGLDHL